jgi:hypothetical protein
MRRVIFLLGVASVLFAAGCGKHYARRYAAADYTAAPCGCDGAVGPIGPIGPIDGVVAPGPVVSPQAIGVAPLGRAITSTPIKTIPGPY